MGRVRHARAQDGRGVDVSKVSTGRRMSARRARTITAAGAVLLVGALTACSGGRPGAAAVIDGDRVVPVSDVDSATSELSTLLSGVSPSTILGVLILEPVFGEVAADHDVAVSPDEARAQLEALTDSGDQTFSDASVAVMTYVLELNALQQVEDTDAVSAELTAAQAALDIEVNPRFGSIGADGTIADTTYDWIVASSGTTDAATTAP
jgi:hypothetical protein